jgi:sugar lactone lactonase YvrE
LEEPALVLAAGAEIAECPVWDQATGRLLWVDLYDSALHRFDPASGCDEVLRLEQPISAVARRESGGYVAACRDGFAAIDEDGSMRMLAEVEADRPDSRLNDGRCDHRGRFWAGTMTDDMRPGAGALYRLGADLRVSRVLADVGISNGMDWSADAALMYYVDSHSRTVDVFDFDVASGEVENRRTLLRFLDGEGIPDGLTVDAEGCIWLALPRAYCLHRYTPDGRLDRTLRFVVRLVTSCGFGGAALDELYVTTGARDLTAAQRVDRPEAGGIFRVRPGVVGQPPRAFAG